MLGRREKTATPQAAPQAAARSEETELDEAVRRIDTNDPTLTEVKLYNKNVDDAGAKKIGRCRRAITTIFRSKLDSMVRRICNNDPTLTEVNMNTGSVGDAGAKKFAAALRYNTTLTELYLYDNSIGDEGGKALAEALHHNTALTTLRLYRNSIGDEGGKALAEVLRHNSTLTYLDLSRNSIGEEGAKALAEALRHNTTLTMLNLYANSIGGEGGKAIAEVLLHNTTLTGLAIGGNSIGDDIMKKVQRLIEINKESTSVQEAERLKAVEFGPPALMQGAVPFKGGSEYAGETVAPSVPVAAKISQSQHVIPTVPVAVPVANTSDSGAPPVTSLIDRVKRLEEYLPPEEVMISVSDRVSSLEVLMYGLKQKETSTGSLLERVSHLERDLGIQ